MKQSSRMSVSSAFGLDLNVLDHGSSRIFKTVHDDNLCNVSRLPTYFNSPWSVSRLTIFLRFSVRQVGVCSFLMAVVLQGPR